VTAPPEAAPPQLDRFRACLRPEELESRFLSEFLHRKKRHIAFILLCSAVLSLCYMVPDTLLLATDARRASFNHWLSICFSSYTLGTIWALWRTTQPRRWKLTLTVWWLLAIITICLGNTSYQSGSISYMLIDVLIPVAICLLIPIGFLLQLALAVVFSLFDLTILLLAQTQLVASDLALVVAALTTGLVVGGVVCWQNHLSERKNFLRQLREQQARELAQKLLDEVKTLRGILPICSYCKQIRDDDGYWHAVESYITTHSGADFTHGICPNCLAEHFPREHARLQTKTNHAAGAHDK